MVLPSTLYEFQNMSISDIAMDWINDDLYFIDSLSSSIGVFSINTHAIVELVSFLDMPRKLLFNSR